MTDFHVEIVRIGEIEKHPGADTLGITMVGAYPVIVKLGAFKTGDLAVYIPVDSVVPLTDPQFAFLEGKDRIKAKRLRNIFSQGLLVPVPESLQPVYVGQDVHEEMGITKYLTAEERNEFSVGAFGSNKQKAANVCPKYLPRYTDIENLRRHPNIFAPGQQVIATEKLEGESTAMAYNSPTLWTKFKSWLGFNAPDSVLVRSRNQMKTSGKWHELIDKLDLKHAFEKLDSPEDYSIYGESYGYTKNFTYDADGHHFRVFDVWDRVMERWLDHDEAYQICKVMGLDMVPVLYRGPFDFDAMCELAENESRIGEHISYGRVNERASTVSDL